MCLSVILSGWEAGPIPDFVGPWGKTVKSSPNPSAHHWLSSPFLLHAPHLPVYPSTIHTDSYPRCLQLGMQVAECLKVSGCRKDTKAGDGEMHGQGASACGSCQKTWTLVAAPPQGMLILALLVSHMCLLDVTCGSAEHCSPVWHQPHVSRKWARPLLSGACGW